MKTKIFKHPSFFIWSGIPFIFSIYVLKYFNDKEPINFIDDSRLLIIISYLVIVGFIYLLFFKKRFDPRLSIIHSVITLVGSIALWLFEWCYYNSSLLNDQNTFSAKLIDLTFRVNHVIVYIAIWGQLLFLISILKRLMQKKDKLPATKNA